MVLEKNTEWEKIIGQYVLKRNFHGEQNSEEIFVVWVESWKGLSVGWLKVLD